MKNQAVFTFLIVLMTIFSFGFGICKYSCILYISQYLRVSTQHTTSLYVLIIGADDEASKTEKDCATVIEQTNCVNIQCGNDCAYFFPPETHGSCITPNHCRCFYKSFYCQPDENV
ncbi:hypothetical protein MtrunA17_Chr8g0385831 [Medicago truncatula]|uniref:Uncharacterized protein n=1 Tax=Medicago truncatula TaxID=3880 RepID=A0A396GQ41_MEDTR|nr:hypothetical protein MtrunA17_Chr8g0385831 [Medicago truncatula]